MAGSLEYGDLYHQQPNEKQLAEVTLEDGAPKWYAFKIHLDKGYTPRFTFPNGMYIMRNLSGRLIKNYPEQFGGAKDEGHR